MRGLGKWVDLPGWRTVLKAVLHTAVHDAGARTGARSQVRTVGWRGVLRRVLWRRPRSTGNWNRRLRGNSEGSFRSDWKLEMGVCGWGAAGWENAFRVIPDIS